MPSLPENLWRKRVENDINDSKEQGDKITRSGDLNLEFVFNRKVLMYTGDNTSFKDANNMSFQVILTREYPYPGSISVKALKPIFHPNIHPVTGFVCTAVMKKWNTSNSLHSLYLALDQLLINPNPDDPLNLDAADYWKKNKG